MGKEASSSVDAVALVELLCARICHDLSGPVGATAAGAELFQDLSGGDGETLALVATSAAGAAARLRLLRAALGPAAGAPHPLTALRALVDAHLASQVSAAAPAIAAQWRDCPDAVDGPRARFLLNLALLGRDALPRGGRMELSLEQGRPAVLIHGEPASLNDEVKAALLGQGAMAANPRAAHAAFVRLLADALGGKLGIAATSRGLRVALE